MKIGILYIAIGRYDFFWKDFYESSERYFMQGYPCIREYFVFTDASLLFGEDKNEHIHHICQSDMGWPDNTMERFHLFLSIREQLVNLDYLFFFNANMKFVAPVGIDILPTEKDNGLTGVLHSWYFDSPRWNYPYERRSESMAYIPYRKGKHYYQGSLLGGEVEPFLHMCEVCRRWINKDKMNNIIPVWHDESIVNRYFIDHPPKVLDCRYNYCEIRNLPIEKLIVWRDKTKCFSFDEMKRPDYHSIHTSVKKRYWESVVINFLNLLFRVYRKLGFLLRFTSDKL